MTTCKRYFRNCNEFGLCVNIGKKGYVLAEEPTERKTIFQYGIYGVGKFARIFDPNYIVFEGGKFYDVREYEKDNVLFDQSSPSASRCVVLGVIILVPHFVFEHF